jgi:DNA polymerase elongation subunit (family B)
MITFHILDAFTQDEEIQEETEEYVTKVYNDDIEPDIDDEIQDKVQKTTTQINLEKNTMVIHLFGTTAEGKSVRANVYGFQPYFYVRLPDAKVSTSKRFITRFYAELAHKNIPKTCATVEICKKRLLYGYTGDNSFPFAMIKMNSLAVLRKVRSCFIKYETSEPCLRLDDEYVVDDYKRTSKITGKQSPLELYDANLDPMLRFFHIQNIQPCGWVSIDGDLEGNDQIDCRWDEVLPAKGPVPCAPFLLAIWDIECYSVSGDFPVAKKGDPIIQIGVVLVRAGSPTEKHIFVRGSCDDVPGAIVHSKPTEKEMLIDWAACMETWNADMLIGYNTFGFDERYVWERAQQLKIEGRAEFQALSRLSDLGKEVKLDEKRLSSSALGDNFLFTWSTHGRVQIDLYHYIKRNYNLASYKLDSVCQHFMSGKLTGVDTTSEPGRWVLHTKSTGDVIPGRYIVLLDETGDVAVDKLKVLDIRKGSAVIVEAGEEAMNTSLAVKWAVVKDDVSPADIFRLDRGSAADRARIAAYCVQDCDLTYELYKKLDVFNNAMAMANTCPVPVAYIFMRGQGVKIESLIFKECLGSDQVIKMMPSNYGAGAQQQEESYEGAIVLDPKPGFYFESPVGVADFASLYPSTIESENISHDSLVWVMDYDTTGNFHKFSFGAQADEKYAPPGVLFTDIEFDIWGPHPEDDMKKHPRKIVTGRRVCRYAQPPSTGTGPDPKGTLPTIVRKLLAARKAKRKEAEKETDPFRKALLDAEQLAYKLTANSLYGQLGSGTFKIRLQHLAASVTAYGRQQIIAAKEVIEHFYGPAAASPSFCAETVYGDTDSLFINFNPRDPLTGKRLEGKAALEATMRLTEEAGQLFTQGLKPPHDFEYDKVFYPFIIFSKKRYVGNKYEEDPDHYSQTSMGIATKRRDNAPVVKTIYGGAIRILLTDKDIPAATEFVQEKTMDLVSGKMSMNQLTISKSLRAEYKTPSPPAHKMLAMRMAERDPGNAPGSGERIPYVYIRAPIGQEASKLQGDRIEHPSYVKEKGLQLDTQYYIEHQLMNPLSQLFSLCLTQMPGYKGHKEGMEEVVASELLFQKAISEADKQSREKLAKMFGMTIIPRVNSSAPLLKSVQPQQPGQKKLQGTLDRYMLDSMLIDASKAATAKAVKAAKAADAKAADAKAADAKAADSKAADAKAADSKPKKSSRAKKTADVNV